MNSLGKYMGKARRKAKCPELDLNDLEKEMEIARSKLYKEIKKGNKGELIWVFIIQMGLRLSTNQPR